MLRRILIGTACLGIGLISYADETVTNAPCNNAWSGATNARPEWFENPKDLADEGHLLDASEKALMRYWDEDIYTWYEPEPPTDYTYLLFTIGDGGPEWGVEDALLQWSFNVDIEHVDDRDPNRLHYWDGGEDKFIQLDSCSPDDIYAHYTNVWVAFENNGDAENVTFLLYGYTPYSDETWAKCNTVNINLYTPDP